VRNIPWLWNDAGLNRQSTRTWREESCRKPGCAECREGKAHIEAVVRDMAGQSRAGIHKRELIV
jgi:hypothetical protein